MKAITVRMAGEPGYQVRSIWASAASSIAGFISGLTRRASSPAKSSNHFQSAAVLINRADRFAARNSSALSIACALICFIGAIVESIIPAAFGGLALLAISARYCRSDKSGNSCNSGNQSNSNNK